MRGFLLAAFCYTLLLLGLSGGDLFPRPRAATPAASRKIDGSILYCNPAVVKQFKAAWDAADRGTAWATPKLPASLETGFRIDYVGNRLEIGAG